MKFALLVSRTLANGSDSGSKNIGDYIQSLAAAQYLPRIDEYFDKTAEDFGTNTIKMIMNAWYIWNPDRFPVSKRIIPLPISMHISPFCAEKLLLNKNVFQWFKKNEPIGCRDTDTADFLLSKGIKSYFSGCLTLTLGKKYKFDGERSGLIFVDPYLPHIFKELNFFDWIKVLIFGICHLKSWIKIAGKFNHSYCIGKLRLLRKSFYSACFLKIYSSVYSMNQLLNADFVTHIVRVGKKSNLKTEKQKLDFSENLVKKYAGASFVVTGRIHCALPCLGLETPVILTLGNLLEKGSELSSAGRFGGLIDFFNFIRIKKLKISEKPSQFPLKNKENWRCFAKKLENVCLNFVKEDSDECVHGGKK